MPQAKAKELTALTVDELDEKYQGLKKELMNLRFQVKMQKLTDISRIRKTKRLIAQILTIKNQMERAKDGAA